MPNDSQPGPDKCLDSSDPGDDTASRFRYQWYWAAIVSCMILDDTEDVIEVYCEHHEDVMVKHRDGSLSGHQVKTRSDGQELWKSNDEAFQASCARFAKLDDEYPGHFRGFRFLTNYPLYIKDNSRDIRRLLQAISGTVTVGDLPISTAKILRQIALRAGVDESSVFSTLSKTKAFDDLPKRQDVLLRLVNTITGSWPEANSCSHDAMLRAAICLVEDCGRASSLDHEQFLPGYILAKDEPEDAEVAARINGKRMTATRICEVLETGRNSTATLDGNPADYVHPGTGSTELLNKKLDAGGFFLVSMNSAEDLRDKADYLGLKWTKQHGSQRGLQQYDHIRTLVLSDAARAFEAAKAEGDPFGEKMLEALRSKFQERRAAGDQLFDCTDEHLEGLAYSLTSQCKVQWSIRMPWEDQ